MVRKNNQKHGVFKPAGRRVWPHEYLTAEILAENGHFVEFLPENDIYRADILLDGVEYELKSPRSYKSNSMEQLIKDALYNKKCPNIVFDSLRLKGCPDYKVRDFLIMQAKSRKKIKNLLFVTKQRKVIDILQYV